MRKQVWTLSVNSNTPIPFFLGLSLRQLTQWIRTNNQIIEESKPDKD